MSAPHGEKHGKGKKYPDWLVTAVRMEYYDFGASCREISRILNIPYDTVTDWIGFHTRVIQ